MRRIAILTVVGLLVLLTMFLFGDGLVAACAMHQQIRGGCV